MNENLQSLHGTANDTLVRLLFERVRDMRGGAIDISQAAESCTGGASVPTNAPGQAGQGGDIASGERKVGHE